MRADRFGIVRQRLVDEAARESLELRGSELRFTFGPQDAPIKFSGTVRGSEVTGVLSAGTARSTAARTVAGKLRGPLRYAAWAEMPPDCRQYYDRQPSK